MKAVKVFNNNSASVIMPDGREAVVTGSGIGFGRRPGEEIDPGRIEKIYYIQNELQTKFLQLLNDTKPEYLTAAEAILAKAGAVNLSLRQQVLITLTDHIAFAAERLEKKIDLPNLMLTEIRMLYPTEYQVGVWALKMIRECCGLTLPEDEAGYIALHLVNASSGAGNAYETLKFVNGAMNIIKETYGIELDENNLDTMRLRTHLKFLAGRIFSGTPWEVEDDADEMYRMLLKSNRRNAECLMRLGAYTEENFRYTINQQEKVYLLVHFTKLFRNRH